MTQKGRGQRIRIAGHQGPRRRALWPLVLTAVVMLLAVPVPAISETDNLAARARRIRFLPRDARQECVGVPACAVQQSAVLDIAPLSRVEVQLQCPADASSFWNWGLLQTGFLHGTLLETITDQSSGLTGAAIIGIFNANPTKHESAEVMIGCSASRFSGSFRYSKLGADKDI